MLPACQGCVCIFDDSLFGRTVGPESGVDCVIWNSGELRLCDLLPLEQGKFCVALCCPCALLATSERGDQLSLFWVVVEPFPVS